jgi:hypothetical protein
LNYEFGWNTKTGVAPWYSIACGYFTGLKVETMENGLDTTIKYRAQCLCVLKIVFLH